MIILQEYYTINEMARYLRATPAALRLYEEKGILKPIRSAENNYRCYTRDDIRLLVNCKIYQNFGFSLTEISHLLSSVSAQEVDELMQKQEAKIERNIQTDLAARAHIKLVQQKKRELLALQGSYYISSSPHCLACYQTVGDKICWDMNDAPYWDMVAQNYGLFTMCGAIPQEYLYDDRFSEQVLTGFAIDVDAADELGVPRTDAVQELLPQRCVHTGIIVSPYLRHHSLEPVYDWIRKRQMCICGDVHFQLHLVEYDQGVAVRYYEIWIPVADL